ncbi:MAG: hypothetical protein DRJ42_24100 [Deltaproteobacteria bacterium]|nr:MAG: hypothetical protein DRJ42_24100 [Deltaproteobacteria bacterium]
MCRSADIGLECRLAPDSEGTEELRCLPCGQSGGPCCKSPNEPCGDGLACGTDRTCGVPPAGCGHDGEPCCARDECVESGFSCRSGTCRPQVAECDLAIDCDECLEVIGCGYCADFDTCESGDTLGPAVGSCSDWNSTPEMCGGGGGTDRCAVNTDCDDCTFEAGCGWCDDGSGCRSGNSEGPTGGSCGSWDWFGYSCGSDTCAGYRNCETCTNVSDLCGWCPGARTCHDASGLGVPDVGTCDGTFVEWPLECTTGPAPCSEIFDCLECADHPECGWCADSGLCLPSDLDGTPEIGTCGGPLAVFDSECPTSCLPNAADACDPSGLSCCDSMSCRATVSGAGHGACCREAGAICFSGSECCGYMDCGTDGTCQCREASRACLGDGDCCSGFCSSGICG